MRIEISSSGLSGAAVCELQSNLTSYIGDAESVLSGFKIIKEGTIGLNGGVGSLQGALENIEARVNVERNKIQEAKVIQNKVNEFVSLAARVDKCVSEKINGNKDELYRVNPWIKPETSVEQEIPWYEQAWNWLCSAGDAVAEGAKTVWNWVSDTAVKLWNEAVSFYKEHENLCKIAIGVLAIAIAVAVTVVSGGAALPALLALTKAALVGGLVSAALGGTFTVLVSVINGDDSSEILDNVVQSSIDGFCSGFMWGGIFASVMQIISVGYAGNLSTKQNVSKANRSQGKNYENKHYKSFKRNKVNAAQQITIETPEGVKVRVDEIALDKNGNLIINELKSSPTAPLTGNQKKAFGILKDGSVGILKDGGVVKGLGKGIFKNGYKIPPGTEVNIIRASSNFANYSRYIEYNHYLKFSEFFGVMLGGGDAIMAWRNICERVDKCI